MALRKRGLVKPTVYDLLTKEVIPRLKTVEGEVQKVKEDVAGVKKEVRDAGIGNGHSALLAEFLEDQAARKKRGQAYVTVGSDLKRRFQFLVRPRQMAARVAVFAATILLTGYTSAIFWGKLPVPWPFHH